MKIELHKNNSRGTADYGWLKTSRTFSFDNYYDPNRNGFGLFRVLNDDWVEAGAGFPSHPHRDMEIISIPLSGDLEHKDSMGNVATIKEGEIQVMSAGSGVFHSEYNPNPDKPTEFLQLWIYPRDRGLTPRYQQMTLPDLAVPDVLHEVVHPQNTGEGLWIYQQAWISMATLSGNKEIAYELHNKGNGVYVFVIEGSVLIGDTLLAERDGAGVSATNRFSLLPKTSSRVLLVEVPLQ